MNGLRTPLVLVSRRVIAFALAWSLSLSGAPLAAATDTASAAGVKPLGRPLLAQDGAADVVPERGEVLLNIGAIVTTSEEAAALRVAVGSFEGRRLHLVQFAGPIQPEWYADLEATGAAVIQYIPSFAYLVYGDESALARVQEMARSSASVRWDGAYLDGYKIQPEARPETRARLGLPADQDAFAIQLVADPAANGETARLVERRGVGGVRQRWEILRYVNLVVTLPLDAVDEVAARPDVVSIDRHVTPQKFDERQDRILSGQLTGNGPTPGDHLAYLAGKGFTQSQFAASGFVVDVTDSGIDNATSTPNHFALRVGGALANPGRVQYNRLEGTANAGSTLQGCDGHGNLNAHIVAGYVPDPATLPSPATHADASAFRYGLGVCPFVKVGSSVIFDPATYTSPNLPNLQARAYRDNARISTNSWGANAGGAYTVEAQTFDALVRDAQPASSVFPAAGNQEMVVVFSAGNAGPTANTIGSPGVAKNVIAVGAAEGVQPFGGTDGCGVGDASADSANDMAIFSSRGPADDGRVKPDIVAPGTHISGGVFQLAASVSGTGAAAACFDGSGVCGGVDSSEFFPAGQQFYSASSGTSHSAPAVAGGAALVRQHFVNNGLTPPSPAMTKAVLVNSARYMNGTGANDTLPSNGQGMGMMNLEAYFSQQSGPRILFDQRPGDLFTASGQQHTITGTVADGGQPLRVTLAWTDAPGPTSGSAYVNNLDLEVTVGGNTYRGNVFAGGTSTTGGSADPRNNVESVFLAAGLSGPFSVRVVATNVAGDGVPGVGGALDQDYALVISNATAVPQPVVVAGTATVVADSCGAGNGTLDPGEAATVSLCLQNVGSADTTNAVATLLPTGGVTSPGAPQGYGVLTAHGPAVCRSFDFVVGNVICGAAVTPTAQVQDGAADLGSVAWTLSTGTPVVPLTEAFDGVTAPALPAGWTTTSEAGTDAWATVNTTPDTAPNAAFINDPGAISLTSLVSPNIAVPATTAPIALTFRHSYALESGYDGAVLEVKIGAGAFQDVLAAGGSFVAGGYNQTLSAAYSNPLGGRQAWSGSSGGYVTTTANLPASASGQTIQLRWRRGSDTSTPGTGWRVDTLSLLAGRTCCTTPIQPFLSINDVAVTEGHSGTTSAMFTVSLSAASASTVTVGYATANGTAAAGSDYVAASGMVTFPPGSTTQSIPVTVNGDTAVEPNETFFVNLSGATNATIADALGVGTITNDDLAPPVCTSFSISPASASPSDLAGSQLVTITGLPASCTGGEWTTAGNGSWITVSPASGSGSGSATVSWTQNTGVQRTGNATVAGNTFAVTQAGPEASGSDFFTVSPCRLIDTREPEPGGGPILTLGTSRTFQVGGFCGVSVSANAVALNLTVTEPSTAGNCRLYPDPGALPLVSSINFTAGQTRANNAVVPLGPGGTVTVYCVGVGPGSVHLILDLNGYFE